MPNRHDDEPEVPSWLVSAAKGVGMNEIRVRWKLRRWLAQWARWRRELAPASRRFEHQICGECGAVQARDATICSSCSEKLSSGAARFVKSLGFSIPSAWSVSALLGFAMLVLYVRMVLANPGDGIWGWKLDTLIGYGGLWPPALKLNQWWRLATACFLHIGVMHLGFNLVALMQIGPEIEEIFGRGRMVFFFMLTGVLSFAASAVFMPEAPTAGASGALMGLIGVAAGWGQRTGTSYGKEIRNQMLLWGVYTTFFGIMLRANHVAHGAGFVAGALLGFAFKPENLAHTKGSTWSSLMGAVGGLAAAATCFLVLLPPAASRDVGRQLVGRDEEDWKAEFEEGRDAQREQFVRWVQVCELLRGGKADEAFAKAKELPMFAGDGDGVSKEQLQLSCASLDGMRAQCDKFDAAGLEGIYGAELPPDDETRELMGRQFRDNCTLIRGQKR